MNEKVVFFLPTRKGSERVIDKNTRKFSIEENGILGLKIKQLLKVNGIDEIIVSTNDPRTKEIAKSFESNRINIIERPEHLCLSSTKLDDLINYVPTVTDAEHIFWVHTTSPFVTEEDYAKALISYQKNLLENEFDSMMSVSKKHEYLWDAENNGFLNLDRSNIKWPRTQDIKPFYELNHAFFINSRDNYIKYNDRIGKMPFLYELPKIKSFDIDWMDDFELAAAIYEISVNSK
ncbi:acylneuraminate cytidylyltransferase family protein [Pontibacter harenae]|uniref:acylneuraminate cytidylyltransferase family protein n=1 Tax=Pontibacter harenae TaxID=2894083 RepID=UPI001E4028D9|nr:acylneuraminate cytidylyltransferase family protein [Pontibacter harenae]MCC9168237.1 acylneuraminate cytidylyltransferase family protein [Pontibacter harenae]